MEVNKLDFIRLEKASRDTLDVKRIYIDMADDLAAGVLLSQIIYWHLPDQNGKSKLRVQHEGHYWIAKRREDWWDECRLTAKQYDRAAGILEEKGLIVTDTTLFAGKPSKVVRLNYDVFLAMYEAFLSEENRGEKRSLPLGNNVIPDLGNSITENTTENTVVVEPTTPLVNGENPIDQSTPAEQAIEQFIFGLGWKDRQEIREIAEKDIGLVSLTTAMAELKAKVIAGEYRATWGTLRKFWNNVLSTNSLRTSNSAPIVNSPPRWVTT